jgi:hypothetical protein
MKKWLITCAVAAAFFACNNNAIIDEELGGESNNVISSPDSSEEQQDDPISSSGSKPPIFSCKQISVAYDDSFILYDELDPSCKDEQRKLIYVYDNPEINWDYVYSHLPGYAPGTGQVEESGSYSGGSASHNVNGIDMTQEEYEAYKSEYWRKYYEEIENSKKNLPILCVVKSDAISLLALLTEEEVAKLKEMRGGLHFNDYQDVLKSSNSNGAVANEGCVIPISSSSDAISSSSSINSSAHPALMNFRNGING